MNNILYTHCPFCNQKLEFIQYTTFQNYHCKHCGLSNRANKGSRTFGFNITPLSNKFIRLDFSIDNLFVSIDHNSNITTISSIKIDAEDKITFDKIINFNLSDISATLEKMKTLILFS